MIKNVLIFLFAVIAIFSTANLPTAKADIQNDEAYEFCIEVAEWWESHGNYIDKYSWCAGIGSYAEAVCRLGGVEYKLYYGDMWVKGWCEDVTSIEEAECRRENLRKKGETGEPQNVKAFCLQ